MIGLTPAICEELLFRGYIQTRLTQAMHPIFGILIASFFLCDFPHGLCSRDRCFSDGSFPGLGQLA